MPLFVFLIGLSIGSFLNVLIGRLPQGKTILGRSKCDYCKKTLRWFELVPIASWIVQGGRCRRCHHRLSLQYPLVELATAATFTWVFSFVHGNIALVGALAVTSALIVIFVSDLKYQVIPDSMVLLGVFGVLLGGNGGNIVSAIGASVFFFLLWLVTKGRGMGLGDAKLAFLLGLMLGFPRIVLVIYTAFLTGAGVGVILVLGKILKLKSKIAFGPFLVIGALIAVLWGEKITNWWKGVV